MSVRLMPDRKDDAPLSTYHLLHRHLLERFADRLVLTFAQIEDLIGFPLPSQARSERGWWDDGGSATRRSDQSAAWIQAGRRASVNMSSQCVTFERDGTMEAAR